MLVRFGLKVAVTALVVAGVSELGKKSSLAGAILASLPLTSILAMLWLYLDTRDPTRVAGLSRAIFWAVLPSLFFFILLPFLLERRLGFGWSMLVSCAGMAGAYWAYVQIAARLGII